MKELVVISGKGGTGKTSIVAALASLAENAVLVDCDVDAADLHLVIEPEILERHDFSGGSKAAIDVDKCVACRKCRHVCRFSAIVPEAMDYDGMQKTCRVDPIACEGCGVCLLVCPASAIRMMPVVNGQWFVSRTRFGPMVHAQLGIAQENSGKLVSQLRSKAGEIAQSQNRDLILIDGSPGIGCPVIASITGADMVLVVTEPTQSGMHDLERVTELTKHFNITTLVCVNKWDLNLEVSHRIERMTQQRKLGLVGKIRYDRTVTKAQIQRQSVIEYSDNGTAEDLRNLWTNLSNYFKK